MLMDEYILKEEKGVNLEPNLIPIRCEKLNPEEDWSITWRRCRLKGLESKLMGFLFLMVHRLLVMQERIARIGLENGGSICVHCKKSQGSQLHSLL